MGFLQQIQETVNAFFLVYSRTCHPFVSKCSLKTSEKLENVAILLTSLNHCTLMVESVRWLSKLRCYVSRILARRDSLMIDFFCEVASLFSTSFGIDVVFRLAKILVHSFIVQSEKGPSPFSQPDVTPKTGHNLRRPRSRAFSGDFPALSLVTFRAFPSVISQRFNILDGVVFFTENIVGSFLA